MSDVAMMTDPIQQLPSASIVIPAPMGMNTLFDVRNHSGRADPGIVIQIGRRSGAWQTLVHAFVIRPFGEANFDPSNPADHAIAHDFSSFVKVCNGTLPRSGLPDAVVFVNGFDNGLLFSNGAGEGFFTINIFVL